MLKRSALILIVLALLTLSGALPALADDSGLTALCGNGCATGEDGDPDCTDWAPASGNSSCQAKAICSGDQCTSWVVELDLPGYGATDLMSNPVDPVSDPTVITIAVISEAAMRDRISPENIRQVYAEPPNDDGRYRNTYGVLDSSGKLRDLAAADDAVITFTCLPPGSGARLALDAP